MKESAALPTPVSCENVMVMGFVDQIAFGVVVAERTVAADPTMTRLMEITTRRCGKYRLIVDMDCKGGDWSSGNLRLCVDGSDFAPEFSCRFVPSALSRNEENSFARARDCSPSRPHL